MLTFFGIALSPTAGRWEVETPVGSYKIQGKRYYYVWIAGLGVQKDVSEAHDGSEWIPECPFLLPDPGDGTRPCALVGTQAEWAFDQWCRDEPTPRGDKHKNEWIWRYPGCSLTWELVE